MAKRRRNGVVKQLSNLSIDEVSLVDRGANQHALVAITKRAPEAADAFEPVEKFGLPGAAKVTTAARDVARGVKRGRDITVHLEDPAASSAKKAGFALGHHEEAIAGGAAGGFLAGGALEEHGNKVRQQKAGFKKALDEMDLDGLFEDEVSKDWSKWNAERKQRAANEKHDAKIWVKETGGYGLKGFKERNRQVKSTESGAKSRRQGYEGLAADAAGIGLTVHGTARGSTAETAAGLGLLGAGTVRSLQSANNGQKGLYEAREAHLGDRARAKNPFKKALDDMNLDDLFDVEKKSSFGRGGQSAGVDQVAGSDLHDINDQPNGEDGDVGPDGTIGGVERTTGEDTPPKKAKKKGGSPETNPSPLGGVGKSADFWTQLIEKALEDEDDVSKHFPGAGGNPQMSPFPGAQGPGMAPTMQTGGVQPMGMGQPTPPPGAPTGGMPQQLPPDVVQYIQQLEQALEQAQGGGDSDGDNDNSDDTGNSDDSNKNPFGKSGDFGMDTNDLFLAELAKSLDEEDNRELIGKAYEAVSKAEERAQRAEEIAKAERDLRLEREFIAKADEFNVPVSSQELGPVLKRLAESVTKDDFQTIVKCLRGTSEQASLFGEVGKRGGGDNSSVLDEVNARAMEFTKSLTPEQAVAQVFEMDPRAYDAYVAERRSARNF